MVSSLNAVAFMEIYDIILEILFKHTKEKKEIERFVLIFARVFGMK